MTFEFATATRIVFGAETLKQAGTFAAELGSRALVVGGANPERLRPLLAALTLPAHVFSVSGEPTVALVEQGVAEARKRSCDVIIGMGGGSVLDAGKAIAALLTNPRPVRDYLEVIGENRPLSEASAPYLAIPTTAGTGAEVTRNAVLLSPEEQIKVSLRSASMLPRVALVDPELTLSLPPDITATTGLDALTQCLEPFVSPHASPLTDGFCREGMGRVARSLRRAVQQGSNLEARTDMALASLCGGLALANAKLGAVHGFAAPLGGMFPAPHGAICARLLPRVMGANIRVLREREPSSPVLERYSEIARILTGDAEAVADDGVRWVEALCRELSVRSLSSYGVTERDVAEVVAKAERASSMQGNPVKLTTEELEEVLGQAL